MKADVLHTSQFFLRLIKEREIKPEKFKNEYVHHDPCVLARKLRFSEEPRELLKSIPGSRLTEA